MKRVVISGYYGFGNAGDEAVLAAMLHSLRQQSAELECSVLSAAPEQTRRLHDVPAFHRARPRDVLTALRGCDLFISGGGSLLQDVTSLNSLLFYLAQIRLARTLRRRVMIYAQGIGPLDRSAARRLTASVLRGVDWITVRDQESAQELRRIGVPAERPPVEVTADPVFALEPAADAFAEQELAQAFGSGEKPKRLLGVSVREWPSLEGRLVALGAVIREAAEAIGAAPVYFPLQRAQDAPVCRRLAEMTAGAVLPGEYSPSEWMALAGRTDLFLGMRLHALIFAAVRGVPLVGLTYDPKVTSLLARLGQTPATSITAFDPAALARAIRETWNVRAERSVQLREAAQALATAAALNAQRAVELLAVGQRGGTREARTASILPGLQERDRGS
jgi:polysaccharide pyruvyl transferase CsaB